MATSTELWQGSVGTYSYAAYSICHGEVKSCWRSSAKGVHVVPISSCYAGQKDLCSDDTGWQTVQYQYDNCTGNTTYINTIIGPEQLGIPIFGSMMSDFTSVVQCFVTLDDVPKPGSSGGVMQLDYNDSLCTPSNLSKITYNPFHTCGDWYENPAYTSFTALHGSSIAFTGKNVQTRNCVDGHPAPSLGSGYEPQGCRCDYSDNLGYRYCFLIECDNENGFVRKYYYNATTCEGEPTSNATVSAANLGRCFESSEITCGLTTSVTGDMLQVIYEDGACNDDQVLSYSVLSNFTQCSKEPNSDTSVSFEVYAPSPTIGLLTWQIIVMGVTGAVLVAIAVVLGTLCHRRNGNKTKTTLSEPLNSRA